MRRDRRDPLSTGPATGLNPLVVRYLAAALLIAALGVRVAQVERTHYAPINDAASYLHLASTVANTGGYTNGRVAAGGTHGPTAYFPPAYPYLLAGVDLLSGHTHGIRAAAHDARLANALIGTVIVALTGLVAFELFGATTALIALAIAAFYPVLIELSAVLVAENLMVALELAAVWAVLRSGRSFNPQPWTLAAGVLTGLAALSHQNAIVVVIPLALAAYGLRSGPAARRARAPALLIAATIVTIAPWTIRNAIVMHRLIPISDETGITLAGTYNPTSAAAGEPTYGWRFYNAIPADTDLARRAPTLTEPELGDRLQRKALDYIADHPLSPLEVAFDNTRRMLELEGSFAWHVSAASIGIDRGSAHLGVLSFWLLTLAAIAGAFTKTARAAPRWVWSVPILLALSAVLVNGETPRFREPVEPFLILLAACALARAAGELRSRSASPA